jgi:hypothetical protein
MAPVTMWWFNAGVAPVYREYDLAIRIGTHRVSLPADVRKWLPGDSIFEGTIYIDDALVPGTHRIAIALLDPRTGNPAIRLAQEGRLPDGWYDLGTVVVEAPTTR